MDMQRLTNVAGRLFTIDSSTRFHPARTPFAKLKWALPLLVACCTPLLSGCGSGGSGAPPITASTTMTGDQEVPLVMTVALGSGSIDVDPVTKNIAGSITTSGIAGTAAHIHEGAPGTNGPVIIPLDAGPGGTWTVPAGSRLTDSQFASFQAGNLYYNVHSAANPGGEIRGYLGVTVRGVILSGGEEVPANASAASGTGFFAVNPNTKAISGSITTTGITATVAHIHEGPVGVVSPVIVPLTAGAGGVWTVPANTKLTDSQFTSFLAGNLYVNVHSSAFPVGEIRSQIGVMVKNVNLTGVQESPPNNSTASGVGSIIVDPVTRSISGSITTTGITATVAHIHEGAVGVVAPVIVPLTAGTGGAWTVPANTKLTDSQFGSFLAGNLYVNVHSAAFPVGEIRDQIGVMARPVSLSGRQESPANSSTATGVGAIIVNPLTRIISGSITTTGITATVAHIHEGAVGVVSPVIVPLTAGTGGVWSVPANTKLTDSQYTSFRTGNLYVNVHSAAFPVGELRDQIGVMVRPVSLSGLQESPPNASTATGAGAIIVDPLTRIISGSITTTGITATVAHIHEGPVGVVSPVIVPLTAGTGGLWTVPANTKLTDSQYASFLGGNLYVNVHSAAFPVGEIRGQIAAIVRTVSLSGSQESPPNASTATGVGVLIADPVTRIISGSVTTTGITGTVAHIHEGPVGVVSPVIVPLTAGAGGVWTVPANTTLTASQFASLLAGNLYFNVHSAAFPDGEIRGQIL